MYISRYLRKPSNWQDFERLCCEIAKIVWNDPYAKIYGRSGQKQDGVDIVGIRNGSFRYSGMQCKRCDKISESMIDEEISKAKKFQPALEHLVFATTMDRDVKIQEYIRKKDVENRKNCLFSISILEWDDLVDILEQNQPLLNWYENHIGIGVTHSIKVSFPSGKEETTIHPRYIENVYCNPILSAASLIERNASHHIMKPLGLFHPFANDMNPVKGCINHSYCPIEIQIDNLGLSAIEPISLILSFPDCVAIKQTNEYNPLAVPKASLNNTHINTERNQVSVGAAVLLPERRLNTSQIFVRPTPDITEFEFEWHFSSRDFTKMGTLKVSVSPEIRHNLISSNIDPQPKKEIVDDIEEFIY